MKHSISAHGIAIALSAGMLAVPCAHANVSINATIDGWKPGMGVPPTIARAVVHRNTGNGIQNGSGPGCDTFETLSRDRARRENIGKAA